MATATDYKNMLIALLPKGEAWDSADIVPQMTALAEELARIDARLAALIEESDPRTVTELIDEWETDWSLPTECTGPLDTLEKRRDALINRIRTTPDQSRQTYIDFAEQAGYTITITEYSAGDAVPGHPEIPTADAAFVVQINSALTGFDDREMGDDMGEPFATWGDTFLECTLRELSQAHHVLIFAYS